MNSRLSKLRFRKLSLKGKVIVLNSLILSKAAIIELPDDNFEEIENLALNFLWGDWKYDLVSGKQKTS